MVWTIKVETRKQGAIGVFTWQAVDITSTTSNQACELAGEHFRGKGYETRFVEIIGMEPPLEDDCPCGCEGDLATHENVRLGNDFAKLIQSKK